MSKISYEEALSLGLTKKCKKCGRELTVDNFNKLKDGKYGVRPDCKECRASYKKRYQQENKEKIAKRKSEYYQKNKERIDSKNKEWAENNREKRLVHQKKYRENNKEKIAEWQKTHKEQHNANNRKYYEANKDKKAIYQTKYRKTEKGKMVNIKGAQKRRALKRKSVYIPFTEEAREFCLEYFNNRCPYTGVDLMSVKTNDDHIVALSDKNGIGATAPWNMLVCEASINSSKKNKPVLEFIETLTNSKEVYNNIRNYIILQAKKYIDHVPKDDITLKTFNISYDDLLQ